MGQNVAILGASNKPERFAYRVLKMFFQYGHGVFPVHPTLRDIENIPVVATLNDIQARIDTLTLYVGPEISKRLQPEIESLSPRRVIFNPGSENPALAEALRAAGILTEDACTLVLLRMHRFAMD